MEKVYTVTQINQYISDIFVNDPELSYVAVKGEISNFTNHAASGHYYFTIKDNGSKLNCVMFKNYNRLLKFIPQNGLSVVIRGYINSYVQRGEYQLYASSIEKEGTGELYKKFLELKEKLDQAGYFNPERKKKLPLLPRRVGVVTAPEGSVVCDIINVLKRRFQTMPILIAPAYVQGALAADSISKALAYLNTIDDIDVIILARGGGSLEELWPFNEEKVADAIYNSKKPVISAVGHQTDFTISDFVSDLRAPTPSAAAELVVFSKNEAIDNLDNLLKKYRNEVNLRFQKSIESDFKMIERIAITKFEDAKSDLENKWLHFNVYDYRKVLKIGYSIVRQLEKNRIIKSAAQIKAGDKLHITLTDGTVTANAESVQLN